MILYPPIIGDTVPAFVANNIIINFTNNPAVNLAAVTRLKLIIKELNGQLVGESIISTDLKQLRTGTAIFTNISAIARASWSPTVGTSYKFQLSYGDSGDFRAFSSVAIGKCIGYTINDITATIKNLSTTNANADQGVYIGQYSCIDPNETLYSYRFCVKEKDIIIQDSGEILYNNNLNATIKFYLAYELLPENQNYTIEFTITTINGYTTTTSYQIIANTLDTTPEFELIISQNEMARENGYIQISFAGNAVAGTYAIERSSNGIFWEELIQFTMTEDISIAEYIWNDYSVEQGISYIYAIRTVQAHKYGPRKLANSTLFVQFDDMFLSDGQTQLKIKFNPKVSSFKTVIQEQKIDTIGSKYPYFFRNGMVNYKEIPISGLLSYLMDDNELFATNIELGLPMTPEDVIERQFQSTELTNSNIAAERKFKLKVLDWLNNGKPKLFRSPTEGNYIVRLMNVSLSPTDTLGRMLHTFTATGYEVADNDIYNMIQEHVIYFPTGEVTASSVLGLFVLGQSILGGGH